MDEVKQYIDFYWYLLPHFVSYLPYNIGLIEGVVLSCQGNTYLLVCLPDNIFAGVYKAAVYRSIQYSNEGRSSSSIVVCNSRHSFNDQYAYMYVYLSEGIVFVVQRIVILVPEYTFIIQGYSSEEVIGRLRLEQSSCYLYSCLAAYGEYSSKADHTRYYRLYYISTC